MPKVDRLFRLLLTIFDLLLDALRFIRLNLQPRCTLAAEDLFLRKQLALYLERQVEPRRPRAAAKLTLVLLSRLFPRRQASISSTPPVANGAQLEDRFASYPNRYVPIGFMISFLLDLCLLV